MTKPSRLLRNFVAPRVDVGGGPCHLLPAAPATTAAIST
eukprot:CAMPEP_0178603258 /NCGR_PEP_ID=MMETSP0697-20121206/35413_1 /TAXON_ID=265572 /ORGANISM="Extubocellulus spinifer, Strain CCMP396" /LENGTH=38 /DNA_ID= /DNA_START= /DNA_END= /DNA_ORIENTATION=